MRTKKHQYFLKDKKALIYRPTSVDDDFGPKTHFVATTNLAVWCYSTQLSQSLAFLARTFLTNEVRMFVFNRGTEIKVYYMIFYRDQWYEVTRVDTRDDYDTDIFVYVKDAPMGNKPYHGYGWTP